jgi:hypothetical protein
VVPRAGQNKADSGKAGARVRISTELALLGVPVVELVVRLALRLGLCGEGEGPAIVTEDAADVARATTLSVELVLFDDSNLARDKDVASVNSIGEVQPLVGSLGHLLAPLRLQPIITAPGSGCQCCN